MIRGLRRCSGEALERANAVFLQFCCKQFVFCLFYWLLPYQPAANTEFSGSTHPPAPASCHLGRLDPNLAIAKLRNFLIEACDTLLPLLNGCEISILKYCFNVEKEPYDFISCIHFLKMKQNFTRLSTSQNVLKQRFFDWWLLYRGNLSAIVHK